MKLATLLLASCGLAIDVSSVAAAQDASPPAAPAVSSSNAQPAPPQNAAAAPSAEGVGLEEIVVTATPRAERKMDTSIAVSSVNSGTIQQINPQSAADLVRFIPGIRAEASGGEGNANISVRGLPVASGGAKFVQFQEDGFPVLDFGDIAFATADAFVKADYNIARVELVRGGSASTATSNAPGAIINFITKTGDTDGGAIGITEGLDFRRTRLDFDYGGHLGSDWKFHIGGFYRNGRGPKTIDYTGEDGGQIKANVTREFSNGFVRLDFKYLNDKSPVYLPVPVAITGAGSNVSYSSLPGFDIHDGSLQTKYLQNLPSLDHNGNRVTDQLSAGYKTLSTAFGGEASFDMGSGIRLDDKFRYAFNKGNFVGPYPANSDLVQNLANGIGGAGSTVTIASGPGAGTPYAGYAVNAVIFDTTLNNFNTYTNNFTASKDFDFGGSGKGSITVGYFKSGQKIDMDWHWQNYLLSARGRGVQPLNVTSALGELQTQNGLIAYDARAFGDCCVRNYNVQYDIDAPWADAQYNIGGLHLDGSVRYDIQSANGIYAESSGNGVPIDVNQDGIIQVPEQRVKTVNNLNANTVSYTKKYWSWSAGANYEFSRNFALFGRASRGARFNADRVLPADASGNVADFAAINYANQQEVGVKGHYGPFSASLTGFHTTTAEQGTDINAATGGLTIISRDYEAWGAELEASARFGRHFNIYGGVTYTDANITHDALSPGDVNHTPQR